MRSLLVSIFLFGSLAAQPARPIVLVSVLPQKFLVETIAGDACRVEVLVPAGASPHSYEPRARQIDLIKEAVLWLRIGEGFEERLIPLVRRVVDQRECVNLLDSACCHGSADPHIWLSPSLLRKEALQICSVLEELLQQDFQENLRGLLAQLDALEEKLRGCTFSKAILVSHPAFGYFCREFNIEQLSIEKEGKEPSPRQLTELMDEVTKRGLKRIFLQKQYSEKGGLRIAAELGLEVYHLDPYAEDVIANLSHFGDVFCD